MASSAFSVNHLRQSMNVSQLYYSIDLYQTTKFLTDPNSKRLQMTYRMLFHERKFKQALCKMEKMLVISIFSFLHIVFNYSLLFRGLLKQRIVREKVNRVLSTSFNAFTQSS